MDSKWLTISFMIQCFVSKREDAIRPLVFCFAFAVTKLIMYGYELSLFKRSPFKEAFVALPGS